MTGQKDFLLFPHCFKDLFLLNTGKRVHILHQKASDEGEGENASYKHLLLFLCCFLKDFFLSGIKSRDCMGEESNVKKKKTKQCTG